MENLTWLQSLGLTTGSGLVGVVIWAVRRIIRGDLVPKVTVDREREISNQWRTVAETYAENDQKRNEIVNRTNEMMVRVLALLEQAPWLDTAPRDGQRGSPGSESYIGSRRRHEESR